MGLLLGGGLTPLLADQQRRQYRPHVPGATESQENLSGDQERQFDVHVVPGKDVSDRFAAKGHTGYIVVDVLLAQHIVPASRGGMPGDFPDVGIGRPSLTKVDRNVGSIVLIGSSILGSMTMLPFSP
jgi:hypothetical protein